MDQTTTEAAQLRAVLQQAMQFVHEAVMAEVLYAEEIAGFEWAVAARKLLGWEPITPEGYRAKVDAYQAEQHAAAARLDARLDQPARQEA